MAAMFLFLKNVQRVIKPLLRYCKKIVMSFSKLVLVVNVRMPTERFLSVVPLEAPLRALFEQWQLHKWYWMLTRRLLQTLWVIRTGPGVPLILASVKEGCTCAAASGTIHVSRSCVCVAVPVLSSTAPVSVLLVLCIHSRTNSITIS